MKNVKTFYFKLKLDGHISEVMLHENVVHQRKRLLHHENVVN